MIIINNYYCFRTPAALRGMSIAPIPAKEPRISGDVNMKNRKSSSSSGRANMGGNRQSGQSNEKSQRKQNRGTGRSEAEMDNEMDMDTGRERRE